MSGPRDASRPGRDAPSGPGARPGATAPAAPPEPTDVLVAWRLLRRLVGDVLGATEALGADLDALLVWAVLACESVAPPPDASPRSSAPGAPAELVGLPDRGRPRPVRVRDLSRLTGIPRETVRRKLLALAATGRAQQVVQGWIVGPSHDGPLLQRLADESMRRLRDTWRDVEATQRYSRSSGASSA